MDDDARYQVLRNDEDQYSLWLAGHEVPAGWYSVGKEGTRDECSAYAETNDEPDGLWGGTVRQPPAPPERPRPEIGADAATVARIAELTLAAGAADRAAGRTRARRTVR